MQEYAVNIDNLKSVIKDIPTSPGVYGFKDDADIFLYIGKSKHLRVRMGEHAESFLTWLINKHRACNLIISECETDVLDATEKLLIDKYNPRFNKQGNETYYDPSLKQKVSIDIPVWLLNQIQDIRATKDISMDEVFKLSIEHIVNKVTVYDFTFN